LGVRLPYAGGSRRFRAVSPDGRPSAIWLRRHVRTGRRPPFLGHLVFRVEGGLVERRLRWPLGDRLRWEADIECSGPECRDASDILDLVREDIPRLNEARAEVIGHTRRGG